MTDVTVSGSKKKAARPMGAGGFDGIRGARGKGDRISPDALAQQLGTLGWCDNPVRHRFILCSKAELSSGLD